MDPSGRVWVANHRRYAQGDAIGFLRDGPWSLVVNGAFGDPSAPPDGTVWLAGDGLFRLGSV